MAEFNFGDNYRAAGLTVSADTIRMRQEAFEKLRKAMDIQTALDLSRLYFGLPVPRGTDWFRDAFGASDPSFSMLDNDREAAVLAAGLIEAAVDDENTYAGLAAVATAVGGLRSPKVRPALIAELQATLTINAAKVRQRGTIDGSAIKSPAAVKAGTEAASLAQAGDWARTAALFKQVSDESFSSTKTLSSQVAAVVKPLIQQAADLREEVDMLWWHLGGWSRAFDRPFAEMDAGLAAVLAGMDLADLSRTVHGPAAAAAILHRTVSLGRKELATPVKFQQCVDALPDEDLARLELEDALKGVQDICPVLAAFLKAREVGRSPAWHASFAKGTGLKADAAMNPSALAMQVYRERQLLSQIG